MIIFIAQNKNIKISNLPTNTMITMIEKRTTVEHGIARAEPSGLITIISLHTLTCPSHELHSSISSILSEYLSLVSRGGVNPV